MLEWLKQQGFRLGNGLALFLCGFLSNLFICLAMVVMSAAAAILSPFLAARAAWKNSFRHEPTQKRVILSGLVGLGSFVVSAIALPFAAIGYALCFALAPLLGGIVGVLRGWEEGIARPLRGFRDRIRSLISAAFNLEEAGIRPRGHANPAEAKNNVNDRQSVHQASVEKGVERVFDEWSKKYKNKINIDATLAQMKAFRKELNAKRKTDIKTQAAIRCLDRVINNGTYMTLPLHKGTNLREIFLWTFHHMQQPENWLPGVTRKEIDSNFIECLYQIQRAYNLDDKGLDQGGEDRITCFGGSINKLIYGMKPVLKGININYMSTGTAMLKLEALARGKMKKYVSSHAAELKETDEETHEVAFETLPEAAQTQLKNEIDSEFSADFQEMEGYKNNVSQFFEMALPYMKVVKEAKGAVTSAAPAATTAAAAAASAASPATAPGTVTPSPAISRP